MMESQAEDPPKNLAPLTVVDDPNSTNVPNLKGDWHNIFVLVLLYTMQGIAGMGLFVGIPALLQINKNVTYKEQALFSMVTWPFNLKMIWAPLVDALYVQKMGRRKSWLIPVQYLIGGCFIYMGKNIDEWLPETGESDVLKLFYVVFFVSTLVATQDIVVDAWALSMLKKFVNNVVYASTCNAVGVLSGTMISSLFLTVFTSEDFCNKYLRFAPATGGIVTKAYLFYFWAVLFILISTSVAIFKKEKDNKLENNYVQLNIIQNYLLVLDILKTPSVLVLSIALLTTEIGFAAADQSLLILKLIDAGLPKDNVMVIISSMYIVKIITPIILSKYTSGLKPMSVYLKVIPFRMIWGITFVIFIYYITKFTTTNGKIDFPIYYYVILVFLFIINNSLLITMKVAKLSLFNRISDPRFGGTYMAFWNTLSFFGMFSSTTIAIYLIDILTFKECSSDYNNNCSTPNLSNTCKSNGGSCIVKIDGYYMESALFVLFGIGWYYIFKKTLINVQAKSFSHWMVNVEKNKVKKKEISK